MNKIILLFILTILGCSEEPRYYKLQLESGEIVECKYYTYDGYLSECKNGIVYLNTVNVKVLP